MRIIIGSDHAGLALKNEASQWLSTWGHEVIDVGAHEYDADDDYPDFAYAIAQRIGAGDAPRGVLLCGSGVGASIAANKVPGVRAAMCHDSYSAHQGVEHDDMNVLCLGARIVGIELARELTTAFLSAEFAPEDRFQRRLDKVLDMESNFG